MQTIIADGTDKKIRELIEAASKGPVTVIENGHPAAVILSPAEFDRLDEPDRARREAKDRLRATVAAMRAEAAEKGLTEAELERLLADES